MGDLEGEAAGTGPLVRGSTIAHGIVCGIAGTAALSVGEVVERALLGRAPIYAPTSIAGRLASRRGMKLTPLAVRSLGLVLRWSYGAALGITGTALNRGAKATVGRAIVQGAMICGSELVMLPLTGATPPLARWPRAELILLTVHATIFALGAEWARSLVATTRGRRWGNRATT